MSTFDVYARNPLINWGLFSAFVIISCIYLTSTITGRSEHQQAQVRGYSVTL